MSAEASLDWSKAGPLYDGHLRKTVETMTVEERLQWIDEGARMLAWARRARIESGRALPEDLEREKSET